MEVRMRPALSADEAGVLDLLKKTAERLKNKGSKQWNGILDGNDNHHTDKAIESGNVFILEQGGKIAAMMIYMVKKPNGTGNSGKSRKRSIPITCIVWQSVRKTEGRTSLSSV